MNRRTRRRQHALSLKSAKAQRRQRARGSETPPAPAGGFGARAMADWRRALMTTAALTGAIGALSGAAVAQEEYAGDTPTNGNDNLRLTGLPAGAIADALDGDDTLNVETDVGVNGTSTVTGGAGGDSITFNTAIFIGYNAGDAGQVLGDAGADTIVLDYNYVGYSGAGTVDGGADNDSIVIRNNSRIGANEGATGAVLGDGGNDTIKVEYSTVGRDGAGAVDGGEGADRITLNESDLGFASTGTGEVLGDAGNDTIDIDYSYIGLNGAGTVSGGEGNDSIDFYNSAIGANAGGSGQVLGDAGDDIIALEYSAVGRSGAGTVDGGEGGDSISLVYSSVGRNVGGTGQVLGGAGADTIKLDDAVVGLNGDGTVSGGEGDDSISVLNRSLIGVAEGSSGQIWGDAGDDIIAVNYSTIGSRGAATVSGGEGDDSIELFRMSVATETGSTAQVLGDAGNDAITVENASIGRYGSGTVSGGEGRDSIALSDFSMVGAGNGAGKVLGDAGNDTVTLDYSFVGYLGAGTVSGGEGADSISVLNESAIGRNVGATGVVLGDAGNDTITLDNADIGLNGGGTVSGGEGNDSISLVAGSVGRNSGGEGRVLGGAGNDTITAENASIGRNGSGTVSGGEGGDSIALSNFSIVGASNGAGEVLGDAGSDTITLDYSFVGYFGAGTVSGGEGDDSISVANESSIGRNADATGAVLGDGGDDTITLDNSNVGHYGAGTVDGGEGRDSIIIRTSSIGAAEGVMGEVLGDAGDDTIEISGGRVGTNYGAATVSGGEGNDSIALSNGVTVGDFFGAGQILGDAGDDTITLNGGYVGYYDGSGTVSGGEGNDSIALSGGVRISYFFAAGQVLGDGGDDTITLDDSNVGDDGEATVDGGDGNDSIALSGSAIGVKPSATGAVLGSAGDDTITLENSPVGGASGFASAGGGGTVDGGEGDDSIVLTGNTFSGNAIGNGSGATGAVLGGAGDDTIELAGTFVGVAGGSGTVDGGDGNDSIFLNDSIALFAGAVLGGEGDDTINTLGTTIASATIDGGAGDDSIILATGPLGGGATVRSEGAVLGGAGDDTVSLDEMAEFEEGAVVDGGDGVDELAVTVAETSGSLPGEVFQNFEAFRKDGAGTLTVSETLAFSERTSVTEGVLALTGEGATNSLSIAVDGGTLTTDGGAFATESEVSVAAQGLLDVSGDETVSRLTNDGRVEISGDARFRAGTISNNAGGVIDVAAGASLEGLRNTLNNTGTINVAAGGALTDAGDINNLADGVINVDGGGSIAANGANGFSNAGAVNLLAGDLEITGNVENDGTITFAEGVLQTVTVNGDYVQTPDGVLSVNFIDDASDQLVVTGDVELAGELNLASVSGLQTGQNAIEIINATGAVSGSFDVASGLLIGQEVLIDSGNVDVVLNVTVNPVADLAGLSGNQTRVGESLFAALADQDGDGDLGAVAVNIGLLDSEAEIAAAFDDLHPESLDIGLKYLTASQRNFVDQMFEETRHDEAEDGLRLWGGVQATGYNQGRGDGHLGFDGEAYDFTAGVSGYALGPVTLGLAGSYGEYNGDQDGAQGDDVDAQIYRVAASARMDLGADGRGVLGHLSGVVSYAGGETDYEMSRIASADLARVMQGGSVDIGSFDAAARFTLDGVNGERWPVSPYAEVGVSAYTQDETVIGAGSATALAVDDLSNTRGHVGLGARYDHQWTQSTSFHVRAAGVHYFGDTQNAFTSQFVRAGDEAAAFRTHGREVNRQIEFDAAVRHRLISGVAVEARAFGETGDLDVYGARITLNKAF